MQQIYCSRIWVTLHWTNYDLDCSLSFAWVLSGASAFKYLAIRATRFQASSTYFTAVDRILLRRSQWITMQCYQLRGNAHSFLSNRWNHCLLKAFSPWHFIRCRMHREVDDQHFGLIPTWKLNSYPLQSGCPYLGEVLLALSTALNVWSGACVL